MEYTVYADLPRQLSEQERTGLAEALDSIVPGSGCVGPRATQEEVYFAVDAPTKEDARQQAEQYMNRILQEAGLEMEFALEIQQI